MLRVSSPGTTGQLRRSTKKPATLAPSATASSLARISELVAGLPHLTTHDRPWTPAWGPALDELDDAVAAAQAARADLCTRITEAYVRLGGLLRLGVDGCVTDPHAEARAAQLARHLAGHLRLRAEFG